MAACYVFNAHNKFFNCSTIAMTMTQRILIENIIETGGSCIQLRRSSDWQALALLLKRMVVFEMVILIVINTFCSLQGRTHCSAITCSHVGRCMRETHLVQEFSATCNPPFEMYEVRRGRDRCVLCWPVPNEKRGNYYCYDPILSLPVDAKCKSNSRMNNQRWVVMSFRRVT